MGITTPIREANQVGGGTSNDGTLGPTAGEVTVKLVKVDSINGYVYGNSDHEIAHMEALSNPANVIASGYMKFKATILPSGASDNLYYKWTATGGTLVAPSEGTGVNSVKWDAPNVHKTDVTLKLEVKPSSSDPTIITKTVSLKTIRPYVVRVKFVDDWYPVFADGEQQIADNGSDDNPEYDAAVPKSGPVCYEKYQDMQVEVDIAGEKNATAGNNLTKKTEIRLTAKATFGGIERQFDEDSMENNTTNWSDPDYGDVKLQCDTNLPNLVAEYENFEIQWTFTVQNSSGAWIKAYEEESGFSHKTIHKETAGGKTYGFYLIYDDHEFANDSDFKKLTLDYACNWASGKNTEGEILQAILDGFKQPTTGYKYTTGGNCWYLSKDFDHACKALGIESNLHRWSIASSFGVGKMASMYPNQFEPIGDELDWNGFQTAFPDGWGYHEFVEANGKIYDPSAGFPNVGDDPVESWGAYEDKCFEKYLRVVTVSPDTYQWDQNQSGHSSGCESTGQHEGNDVWPSRAPGFVGPPYAGF